MQITAADLRVQLAFDYGITWSPELRAQVSRLIGANNISLSAPNPS